MTLIVAMLALALPVDLAEARHRHAQHTVTVQARRARALARARRDRDPRPRIVAPYRAWLARVRQCESGSRYGIATGNGFYGAYQFTLSSWYAAGGRGMPHHASPLEQDYRAVRLLHLQGRGAWPVCG